MIEASAPVRICDHGGWTDTWFGGPGRVLNVAVRPGVEVSITRTDSHQKVVLDVEAFDDRYPVIPGAPRPGRHPLLEAAIDRLPPPDDVAVEIRVRSGVPAGCGAGTSAAVAVALLGALSAARGHLLSGRQAAAAAYRLEVDDLAGESGIQDQLSAALGGINYIEIDSFPDAEVTTLPPWEDLVPHLTLVYLGRAHHSTEIHRQVIELITRSRATGPLERLRAAAAAARDAVLAHDLDAFGRAMILNHEAQESLHPALVGDDAKRVVTMAAGCGATGWKVNGAGGDGGSVTILTRTEVERNAVREGVLALDSGYRLLPVQSAGSGLTVKGAL